MSDDKWILDLNGIKAKERGAMQTALQSGNDEDAYPFMAKVIKAWPFAGDPADPASYGELGLLEHAEAARRFAVAFRKLNEAIQAIAGSLETHGEGDRTGAPEGADGSGRSADPAAPGV